MTAEEIVKAKWPKARVRWSELAGCWIVSAYRRKDQQALSGVRSNPNEAWSDAAQRIQRDPVEQEGK